MRDSWLSELCFWIVVWWSVFSSGCGADVRCPNHGDMAVHYRDAEIMDSGVDNHEHGDIGIPPKANCP